VNFNLRRGAKVTLMGQNGAGKSTLFKMIMGELEITEGDIHIPHKASIAMARQVIPHVQLDLSLREYFQSQFNETIFDIDPRIDTVLEIVNLKADKEKHIHDFSGGQQARILLASAFFASIHLRIINVRKDNTETMNTIHSFE
jgi:ATPase subunit of ABC transporter with duplicated ATPase domains